MPKKHRAAAVIDIGTNELKLLIAQTANSETETGTVRYLENLSYPLGLGRDTFQTGKMRFDKIDKACEIIKNFQHVIKGCGVRDIRTVATSAVREASNMDYILDQVKIKTGLAVEVIDDREEKNYIYKLLTRYASAESQQSALMVYIGAGGIGVSLLTDGRMPFTRNIKIGSLRMGELFEDLQSYTNDFYKLLEEYLAGYTFMLPEEIPGGIRHFIASGREIGMIAELAGVDTHTPFFNIPRDGLFSLYDNIKYMNPDQISGRFGLDSEHADVLLPAVCIYQNLLRFTSAECITASRVLPGDAVLYEMLYPKTFSALNRAFGKNTLLSARELAKRYHTRDAHYNRVFEYSMVIFEKMKKIHGLGSRDKVLLQTSAILHDSGKYINNREHYRHSFEIVRGSDIVGLSHLETDMVAYICLFHSRKAPLMREPGFLALDAGDRVRVSKLSAILRLADALEISQTKKFDAIQVKVANDALTVTVDTDADVTLENWSFNYKSQFFEEVFGMKAALKIKRSH
ncbi:MAG: HD domain-containing protein [Clostridiales bacterium]|jgi:exopolyphosphatase/guanosine-5'-triphosphate,3'-diphosphate pyrophosphatase|nr:HD domain-containing protein [Clostridiales bacterium]